MDRKSTGYYGEGIACRALEKQGYRLLEKNYTIRGGEIDLIMAKGSEILFVEVKTRRNDHYGDLLESITPQKQKRIEHAAKIYLCGIGDRDPDVRFFAVGILLDENDRPRKVEIHEDIFV